MNGEEQAQAWSQALARREVRCVVWHRDSVLADLRPTRAEELWAIVPVPALGENTRAGFWPEWRAFMASGQRSGLYECRAMRVIEKWGQALEFPEPFTVEFERKTAVEPAPAPERKPARPWWRWW
jgi:hypothetical protein